MECRQVMVADICSADFGSYNFCIWYILKATVAQRSHKINVLFILFKTHTSMLVPYGNFHDVKKNQIAVEKDSQQCQRFTWN